MIWPRKPWREHLLLRWRWRLLTDDLLELRVKGSLPRMEALNKWFRSTRVNFLALICAICKAQFNKVLPYYGFDMRMVGGVHQLVIPPSFGK